MTSPISQERVDWLRERIKVLNAMWIELTQRPAKYTNNMHPQSIQMALHQIQSEKLSLIIELEVISNVLSPNA